MDRPNVHSIEDVLDHRARPGHRVVLVDDTGDWRGGGTAWFLAERGHQVTIVTALSMVGYFVQRMAGDWNLRTRLAQLGASWRVESVVTEWTGSAAIVRNLPDGGEIEVGADDLVPATTNTSDTDVADELRSGGTQVHLAGDAVAARLAVHAIYEGRVLGMSL